MSLKCRQQKQNTKHFADIVYGRSQSGNLLCAATAAEEKEKKEEERVSVNKDTD